LPSDAIIIEFDKQFVYCRRALRYLGWDWNPIWMVVGHHKAGTSLQNRDAAKKIPKF